MRVFVGCGDEDEDGLVGQGGGGYTVVFIRYTATTRINIGDSSLFDRYTSRYHP